MEAETEIPDPFHGVGTRLVRRGIGSGRCRRRRRSRRGILSVEETPAIPREGEDEKEMAGIGVHGVG
jgi:hypothetical protein